VKSRNTQVGETINRQDVVKVVAKSEATLGRGRAFLVKLPCSMKMML